MGTVASSQRESPGPAWEIATLFPEQGEFSEEDYLRLTESTQRLVEFSDGYIEVLPMPKQSHQLIVQFLCGLLSGLGLGRVIVAPFRIRLRQGKFREPDVSMMLKANLNRCGEDYWEGADLVVEVISEDDPDRDLVTKRQEYAEAGIPEYWIVDPRDRTIQLLRLDGGKYVTHAAAGVDGVVRSALLPSLEVNVRSVFAAADLV